MVLVSVALASEFLKSPAEYLEMKVRGLKPLSELFASGNVPDVAALLEWEPDFANRPRYSDGKAIPPLFDALDSSKPEAMTKLLLEAGADVNGFSEVSETSPLFSVLDNPVIVELLLDHGAHPEAYSKYAIEYALSGAPSIKVVELLVQHSITSSACISNFGSSTFSSLEDSQIVFNLLLSIKLDPYKQCGIDGRDALETAIIHSNFHVMEVLYYHEKNYNKRFNIQHMFAKLIMGLSSEDPVFTGQVASSSSTLFLLLQYGIDIHSPFYYSLDDNDKMEYTPLEFAVSAPLPDSEVVELLLEQGANPNHWAGTIHPPILAACVRHPLLFNLLLNEGADPDPDTPVSLFAHVLHRPEVLKTLLEAGIPLSKRMSEEFEAERVSSLLQLPVLEQLIETGGMEMFAPDSLPFGEIIADQYFQLLISSNTDPQYLRPLYYFLSCGYNINRYVSSIPEYEASTHQETDPEVIAILESSHISYEQYLKMAIINRMHRLLHTSNSRDQILISTSLRYADWMGARSLYRFLAYKCKYTKTILRGGSDDVELNVFLPRNGAPRNAPNYSILIHAIRVNNIEAFDKLISLSPSSLAQTDRDGSTPLIHAVRSFRISMLKKLINALKSPDDGLSQTRLDQLNQVGKSALSFAYSVSCLACIYLLIEAGASPTASTTPIFYPSATIHPETARTAYQSFLLTPEHHFTTI